MTEQLENAIGGVLRLADLRPSPETNRAMTALVDAVVDADAKNAGPKLSPKNTKIIRDLSAAAETEMEFYWSQRIAESADARADLEKYLYLENYAELTRRELALLEISGLEVNSRAKVLVIVSGALPLSSYEIAAQTGAAVDNVDSDTRALKSGAKLLRALGAEQNSICAAGETVDLAQKYDLILIAALAGDRAKTKQKIAANVLPHLALNGRILMRSARGNRRLLYPEIAPKKLKNVDLLLQYHPIDYVINSVLIFRRKNAKN